MSKIAYIGLALLSLVFTMPSSVHAQQTQIKDYPEARRLLWSKLYRDGGETLYCSAQFGPRHDRGFNVEHIFPMSWVTKELNCGTRKECRRYDDRFNHIEGDLHNLYPALTKINDARGSLPFGMIKGEQRRYGKCDIEIHSKQRKVEPQPASRGNIARAMLYMADTYGFKLFKRQANLLNRWHKEDPPDAEERRRNDLIEKLQGNRNPYIDKP